MTTLDPLAFARAFLALTVAIDDGDDACLPVLADLLEEAGDARAAGLRGIGNRRPERNSWIASITDLSGPLTEGPPLWVWRRTRPKRPRADNPERLAPRLFGRLPAPARNYIAQVGSDHIVPYPTRSAALLALAEALA